MRKWLILLALLGILVLGTLMWLGGQAEKAGGPAGEQRLEIENVFN